tara:strand:- start:354 stop:1007 length:654 start_codon:yes stop_codon:yes gene_type:complete
MTKNIITLIDANSSVSEAYRALRTNIIFADKKERLRVILVCGASPENNSDSKSYVTANLAVTLAQSGRKTLIMDCDLRHPNQHDIWGVPNEFGLSSTLISNDIVDKLDVGVDNLSIVTSGPTPKNPADLLGSNNMDRLMVDLSQQADFVLLDSPPVLPVTDAAILSSYADGVIVVLNSGQSRRDHLERASEILNQSGARVIGAVLNNAPVDLSVGSY